MFATTIYPVFIGGSKNSCDIKLKKVDVLNRELMRKARIIDETYRNIWEFFITFRSIYDYNYVGIGESKTGKSHRQLGCRREIPWKETSQASNEIECFCFRSKLLGEL